jgi:probable phosphoglycerate mutase
MRFRSACFAILLLPCISSCGNQEPTTTIILARHGQTQANVDSILAGRRLDATLTETGIAQAKRLGQALSAQTFSAFYCSTLTRTYETGNYALAAIPNQPKLEATKLSGLDDVDYGQATGLTEAESAKQFGGTGFPADFGPIDDANFKPKFTEENTYQWFARFEGALKEIGAKEKGHRVLVVSHGASYYWGQLHFGTDKVTGFGNAAYAEITFRNGEFSLVSWHSQLD